MNVKSNNCNNLYVFSKNEFKIYIIISVKIKASNKIAYSINKSNRRKNNIRMLNIIKIM